MKKKILPEDSEETSESYFFPIHMECYTYFRSKNSNYRRNYSKISEGRDVIVELNTTCGITKDIQVEK